MYVLVDPCHMFLSDFKHVFVDVRQFLLFLTLIPVDFCACSFGSSNIYVCGYMYIYIYIYIYRVIHKSLRDFRTRLRNNQDRHGRKEHVNR